MKTSGKILITLLVVLIVIQFFHPAKNISTVKSPNDIAVLHKVPVNVRTILDKACNDCHSNNTRYPWYNNIQPVAWWLDHHVQEGKGELNFNEFTTYSLRKQYHKLEEVEELVKEGEMPLGSYTLIHTDARLTEQEKETLINWANSIRSEMKAKYPSDSLIRKR
jgi:hypothetical protein